MCNASNKTYLQTTCDYRPARKGVAKGSGADNQLQLFAICWAKPCRELISCSELQEIAFSGKQWQ